VTGTIEILID